MSQPSNADTMTPREVVEAVYEGMLRSDREALQSLIDPSIRIRVTKELAYGGDYQGPSGFLELFKNTFTLIKSRIEIDHMFTIGEHQVVAIGRTSGIGLGSGQHFDAEIVHLWTVRNGKLLSFDAFVEDAPITAAINGTATA